MKIKVFHKIEPIIKVNVCEDSGPNFGKEYGVHRDRYPDRDWPEWRQSLMDDAEEVEITPKLEQILIEDLIDFYGSTKELFNKFKEFNIVVKISDGIVE